MGDAPPRTFDAIDVLTRAGDARDAWLELLDEPDPDVDLDALLVSDVLRSTGRVGAALETRRSLVELCALLRAIDATVRGLIGLDELRAGIELHAARTGRFEAFHDARVLLRTLDEVLEPGRITHDEPATRAQVELLHRELQAWMEAELVGALEHGAGGGAVGAHDANARFAVDDPTLRRRAHEHVDELLHGARHHPVTGLLGAAWRRDWSAVPVAGDRIDEDPVEIERLRVALDSELPHVEHVLLVERRRPPRWSVSARQVRIGDGLRRAWLVPATGAALAHVLGADRPQCVLTSQELEFAIVEGVDHHAVLGPRAFVERVLGAAPIDAIAGFREHVEALAEADGDPPSHLLDVATSFGRLRRRAR